MYAVYGCSMGGSIALMTALGQKIKIRHCVMDDGITPYQLPWIVTRFIALKDYLMMMRYADSLLVCKRRGEGENLRYMKTKFPQTQFEVLPDLGHGGLVLQKPELFVEMIENL